MSFQSNWVMSWEKRRLSWSWPSWTSAALGSQCSLQCLHFARPCPPSLTSLTDPGSAGKLCRSALWQCTHTIAFYKRRNTRLFALLLSSHRCARLDQQSNKTPTSSSWPHAGSCVAESGMPVCRLSWRGDTIWQPAIWNKAWNGTETFGLCGPPTGDTAATMGMFIYCWVIFVGTVRSSFITAKFLANFPHFVTRLCFFRFPYTTQPSSQSHVESLRTFCPCSPNFSGLSNQRRNPKLDFSRAFVNSPQKALRTMT